MSEEILHSLDLSNFEICIECIKGKQTNIKKVGANKSFDVLELIYTNICGPFLMAS